MLRKVPGGKNRLEKEEMRGQPRRHANVFTGGNRENGVTADDANCAKAREFLRKQTNFNDQPPAFVARISTRNPPISDPCRTNRTIFLPKHKSCRWSNSQLRGGDSLHGQSATGNGKQRHNRKTATQWVPPRNLNGQMLHQPGARPVHEGISISKRPPLGG